MATVEKIKTREIIDSRGNPTLEVDLLLEGGSLGRFSVPAGASTGIHEAREKRDGDKRFGGLGVKQNCVSIEKIIAPMLYGKDFSQKSFDTFLIEEDGTPDKSKFGANSILGLSMAFAKACAQSKKQKLYEYIGELSENKNFKIPYPMANILNGGMHAGNNLDIQEFMIVPLKTFNFAESVRLIAETFSELKKILLAKKLSVNVGDEGGYAPSLSSNEEAIELIIEAGESAGYKKGDDFGIALDVASSRLFQEGVYVFKAGGEKKYSADELIAHYHFLLGNYPIVSIEDGLSEDDWQGNIQLTETLGEKIMIVGDDLFVTHKERLLKGIKEKAANSILIKLNQVGTLSETLEVMRESRTAGWESIVSHRSGETEDVSITHLAVGFGSQYIKIGSICRGERTAKYNELLRIEEDIRSN